MFLLRQKLMICTVGAAALFALSGCGGSSLSSSSVAPSPASDPVVEGLQPNAAAGGGSLPNPYQETSGLGSPDGTIGYLTAAVDSDSVAIPGIALSVSPSNSKLMTTPLGFAAGGQYFSSQGGASFLLADNKTSAFQAAAPGTPVIFRAAIANGVDPTSSPVSAPELVPSSIKLTSTDPAWASVTGLKTDDATNAPNGYLPMAFDLAFSQAPSGPLANDNYVTGTADAKGNLVGSVTPFALPFTTPGLHNLRVTVADTRGKVHHTDFDVLILTPASAAIVAQIGYLSSKGKFNQLGGPVDNTGTASGAAAISLDGAQVAGFDAAQPANPLTNPLLTSTVVLITTPGSHTLTVTGATQADGTPLTYTPKTLTLTGGQVYVTADSNLPYRVTQ